METNQGTIVTMKKEKGYGFIKPDGAESNKDHLFFHASDVLSPEYQTLQIGERVEYLEKVSKKGKSAYDLVII